LKVILLGDQDIFVKCWYYCLWQKLWLFL